VEKPKISIIIPVYNVEKYLKRCVDSLLCQTLKDIEIILVDDSSTDNSPRICDEYLKTDERVKVIHKPNQGAGMARNSGLEIANGDYVGFVDSDDYVDLNMYKALYDTAVKYDADLVMSGVRYVDGNMFEKQGEIIEKSFFDADTVFETENDIKKLRLGIVGAPPEAKDDSRYGMSVWKNLFRRDVIVNNNLKFMSEREILSEDALFMIDYISVINKAVGINGAFYNYCRNEDSISKSYKKDRFDKSMYFLDEIEKRFQNDTDEYKIYLDRFIQAFCRVVCSQEIMYASDNNIKYKDLKKRLKTICNNDMVKKVLKTYPLGKLPVKQAIFAFAVKHRLYLVQKIVVGLRRAKG